MTSFESSPRGSALFRRLALTLALGASALFAQDVVPSHEDEPALARVVREQRPPPLIGSSAPQSPYSIGPFLFRTRLTYAFTDAEGLRSRGGVPIDSYIHRYSASIATDLSENWSLSYSPSWQTYSSDQLRDRFSHSASLSGAKGFDRLGLQFQQTYRDTTSVLIETGTETRQRMWSSNLSGTYRFTPKLFLNASTGISERDSERSPDTRTWNNSASLTTAVTDRLSLSLISSYAYHDIAESPNFRSSSIMGQVSWQVASKFSVSAGGGQQFSQSEGANGISFSTPVMNASLQYVPFEGTSISASASRSVSPSYFRAISNTRTNWNLGARQRLLGWLNFDASYGRQEAEYTSLLIGLISNRSDEISTFQVGLSTTLFERLSVRIHHRRLENESNVSTYTIDSRQYGIELGYSF